MRGLECQDEEAGLLQTEKGEPGAVVSTSCRLHRRKPGLLRLCHPQTPGRAHEGAPGGGACGDRRGQLGTQRFFLTRRPASALLLCLFECCFVLLCFVNG